MYTTGPLLVCQYEMEIKSLGKLRRGEKSAAPTATGHPEWCPVA